MIMHMRIFMSFHHICFLTRFAPLRKPWAETARLSVLSWRESNRSPRWETLLIFSRITPTVSSICWKQVSQSASDVWNYMSDVTEKCCNANHNQAVQARTFKVPGVLGPQSRLIITACLLACLGQVCRSPYGGGASTGRRGAT